MCIQDDGQVLGTCRETCLGLPEERARRARSPKIELFVQLVEFLVVKGVGK